MAKNISLEKQEKNKKKERAKKIDKTMKTNSLPASTLASSVTLSSISTPKLASSISQPKIENQRSKLNLENTKTTKLIKTKESSGSRDLSSTSNLVSTSTTPKLSTISSTNIQSSKNGELRNRAKSFTPINLTSGQQLAAVLEQHKKLQAVGYKPDHEMIQKTIEVGTSKIGQLNSSPMGVSTSSNTLTNSNTNHLTNQTKKSKVFSSLRKQSSLDESSRQFEEKNNEILSEERKRQLYLHSPFLNNSNDKASSSLFELDEIKKSDMPDSMAFLLTRSAKAREPVAKTSKKQLITKRKTHIKSDSLDSGTSSPSSSTTELKYGNIKNTANKLTNTKTTSTGVNNRSDFARAYALNRRSKSPTSSISSNKTTGLVRSTTFTDLDSRLNSASSVLNSSNLSNNSYAASTSDTKSNSVLASPRSNYVTNEEEIKYKYRTRIPKKTLNGLLNDEEIESSDTRSSRETTSIKFKKQNSLESNLELKRSENNGEEIEPKIRKSRTTGLYLASNLNREIAFDYSDKSSSDDEPNTRPIIKERDKLVDTTDQILYKQRFEQRTNLYKNKGKIKLCIEHDFKYPRDVVWAKFTPKTKLHPEQVILICDSGNDRICVFNTQGEYLYSFGQNGQFNCPASICCYDDGTIVVSDSNQHRIQWFDSKGHFLKLITNKNLNEQSVNNQMNLNTLTASNSFYSNLIPNANENNLLQEQANAEPGEFTYPYGLCYESNTNELYVCDKGNQRVQILDADSGEFKRFLGSSSRSSRLNTIIKFPLKSPNFVDSNKENVIVSDTNSHCVHVLSLNGRNHPKLMLGGEGTSFSKFKYPRGIAIDEFGFLLIGDSGNNRVQIFNKDGSFLKAFGSWGKSIEGEGYFKGIEGISVDDFGDIYVCDRENNRILVF